MGNFRWNVVLSSAARLIIYAVVCAALLALRRKEPRAAAYRFPLGPIFAVICMALMIALFTHTKRVVLAWFLETPVVAFMDWLSQPRPDAPPSTTYHRQH